MPDETEDDFFERVAASAEKLELWDDEDDA